MKTEQVNVDDVTAFEGNPRVHPENQIEALQRNIELYGQIRPIVIDENNTILAGHSVVEAVRKLGWSSVTALRVEGLSDKEKKKLVITDNRVADLGHNDFDILEQIIRDIDDYDIPGFSREVLDSIYADSQEDVNNIVGNQEDTLYSKSFADDIGEVDEIEQGMLEESPVAGVWGEDGHLYCPECGEKLV